MIRRKAIWLLLAAYVAVLAAMTGLPWGDLPNHLTRITIIGELLSSPTSYYHQHYSFHWMLVPYVLWDVLAAGTSRLLPVEANGVLWTVLTFLSVVWGGWCLAKVCLRAEADRQTITAFSILTATGWSFVLGFFAYQISLGLCLLAVACGCRLRETRDASSRSIAWLAYIASIVACYLAHLGGFLALCIILGSGAIARVIRRRDRLSWEAAALVPPVLLGCSYIYVSMSSLATGVHDPIIFRPALSKVWALAHPWTRFSKLWEWPVLLGLGTGFALLFIRTVPALRARARDAFLNDLFFPVPALAVVYLILPQGAFVAWNVDMRLLPFLAYFLLLWLLSVRRSAQAASDPDAGFFQTRWILIGTCWVSLLVLLIQLWPYNLEAHKYWEALKRIPAHQIVLPVGTHPYLGRVLPMHHQGTLYAAFKEGIAPQIYSSENATLPFFRPREHYVLPTDLWYVYNIPHPDWKSMASTYDYLVVSKPFDPARFPIPAPPVFTENDVVVIYKLNGTEDSHNR